MFNTFSLEIAKELYNSDDQFPVDFDLAWQWLEYSTKQKGQQSFDSCEMAETIDFTRFNQKVKTGCLTRDIEKIKMTVNAFKCWAMMSKTETGKLVRQYFLECEKVAKTVKRPTNPLSNAQMFLEQAKLNVIIVEEQQRLAEEQQRLADEQKAQAEEQQRLADEQKAQAEEQQRIINEQKVQAEEQQRTIAEIVLIKSLLTTNDIPDCPQTKRQRIVEITHQIADVLVERGSYPDYSTAISKVWRALMAKIKHSSARIDIPNRKASEMRLYERLLADWNAADPSTRGRKPLKTHYNLNYSQWIERLHIEDDALKCVIAVGQDFLNINLPTNMVA